MDDILDQLLLDDVAEVVVLPRDPETAYVYWQKPSWMGPAELRVVSRAAVGEDGQEVGRFAVSQERGGQFFHFSGPDREHRCELLWEDQKVASSWVRSPRRKPGSEEASFVHVEWTEKGLVTTAVDHEVEGRGFFGARSGRAVSSGAFYGAEE